MSHTNPILYQVHKVISINMLQRPLKLGRLIVLQITDGYERFSFHGKLLISSPLKSLFQYVSDFTLQKLNQAKNAT